MTDPINHPNDDPIKRASQLITEQDTATLERRLKEDIFASIARIKPDLTANVDFDTEVASGAFFTTLSPPLQGIAIARCEGALAFYNRVGWHVSYLDAELTSCVPEEGLEPLKQRYHARTLHDLAYVHPKHLERMLSKPGAASLWERLKRYTADAQANQA